MKSIEIRKNNYLQKVYKELNHRGISTSDIPKVIAKTGFIAVLDEFPEEQLHYSVKNAVNEILAVAATK